MSKSKSKLALVSTQAKNLKTGNETADNYASNANDAFCKGFIDGKFTGDETRDSVDGKIGGVSDTMNMDYSKRNISKMTKKSKSRCQAVKLKGGFYKVYRSENLCNLFKNPQAYVLLAYLLDRASLKDRRILHNGKLIMLKQHQVKTSIIELHGELGQHRNTIRANLKILQDDFGVIFDQENGLIDLTNCTARTNTVHNTPGQNCPGGVVTSDQGGWSLLTRGVVTSDQGNAISPYCQAPSNVLKKGSEEELNKEGGEALAFRERSCTPPLILGSNSKLQEEGKLQPEPLRDESMTVETAYSPMIGSWRSSEITTTEDTFLSRWLIAHRGRAPRTKLTLADLALIVAASGKSLAEFEEILGYVTEHGNPWQKRYAFLTPSELNTPLQKNGQIPISPFEEMASSYRTFTQEETKRMRLI